MNTTQPSQGSILAPTLVLVGPLLSFGASFVASAGAPFQLVQEAGTLAFVAIGALFVVTLAVATLLFMASGGGSRLAAAAPPLALLPSAIMLVAAVLGAGLVASAVAHVDPASKLALVGVGISEVMASRMLGAAVLFGSALMLSPAMLALSRAGSGGEAGVAGSALAALVLLGVAAVALAVLADATVLRRGLSSVSGADPAARATLVGHLLLEARVTYLTLLAVLGLTTFLGFGAVMMAVQRGSTGGALVVGATWLVGALFGGADIAMVQYAAATLAVPTPWEREPDFAPLALEDSGTSAVIVDCLATLTRVRCVNAEAGYDALDGALPPPAPTAVAVDDMPRTDPMLAGVTLAGVPALTVALDSRLSASQLRQLLLAAVRARYRSLIVVGAWTPPAFREGEVPPLLRGHALSTPTRSWLLALAVSAGGDGMAPIVIEVRDEDTAESVARRASEVVDQNMLVVPAPLPPVAPPAPPPVPDVVGLLGTAPAGDASAEPLDAPAISRVIRAHVGAVRACYERGLRDDPDLGGRVMVRFTITPSGAVTDVTASPTLAAPPVLRCMEAAVAAMTFPADEAREPVSVNYPFVFNAP